MILSLSPNTSGPSQFSPWISVPGLSQNITDTHQMPSVLNNRNSLSLSSEIKMWANWFLLGLWRRELPHSSFLSCWWCLLPTFVCVVRVEVTLRNSTVYYWMRIQLNTSSSTGYLLNRLSHLSFRVLEGPSSIHSIISPAAFLIHLERINYSLCCAPKVPFQIRRYIIIYHG